MKIYPLNKIITAGRRYKSLLLYVAVTLLLSIFLLSSTKWLLDISIISSIKSLLVNGLGESCIFFLHLMGYNTSYVASNATLIVDGIGAFPLYSHLYISYFFINTILTFLPGQKILNNIYLFLWSTLVLILLLITKNSLLALNNNSLDIIMYDSILSIIQRSFILVIFLYKIKSNPLTKEYFDKIRTVVVSKFHFSLSVVFLLALIIKPFLKLIDFYLFQKGYFPLNGFINFTLIISQQMLALFGYETTISNQYFYMGEYCISIGTPCLGLGIMSMFSFVILTIRSNWINKILFFIPSIIFLILMNAFRLAVFLLYVYKNKGVYTLSMEFHDLSNNFFYVLIILLFILYIFWFQNLKIKTTK